MRSTQRPEAVMSHDIGLNKQEGNVPNKAFLAVFCALKYNVCLYF